MPNQKNIHQLAEISKALADSKAVILTDYAGLTVAEQTALRNEADKQNSTFMVAKNNLLRLALKEKDSALADSLADKLQGPTAVLFSQDAVAGAKVAVKFSEDHDKLKVKSGIMDGKMISLADVIALSKLPSRDELLAKLLAQLQAPAQALVRQLNAPIQNLVYGLEALKAKLS
ncbi:MAG TPA: 50S ribosomal protein L10 [Patescibacteria group bacterium]